MDLLQDVLTEAPDAAGRLEHSHRLGMADDAQQAQQECVDHAVLSGHGKPPTEAITADLEADPEEVTAEAREEVSVG